MVRTMWRVLVVALAATPMVLAQVPVLPYLPTLPNPQPIPKVDAAQVAKLVQQLGDARFEVRDQASKELEKLGIGALPLLREAAKTATQPEVRRRIEEVLPQMEQAAALQPRLINVDFKDTPIRKAIEELTRQSGYKFDIGNNGGGGSNDPEKRVVTLRLKDAPFWEALDRLCDVGGLTFSEGWYSPDQESLHLDFGESHVGLTCLYGAFRVSIRGFDYQRSLYFNQGPQFQQQVQGQDSPFHRNESLRIDMNICIEPRLPMAAFNNQVTLTEALDDQNQSLLVPLNEMNRYYYGGGMGRSFMQNLQAQLQPSVAGKRIKSLKGSIPVTVVSAQKPKITVDKILEVKNKTFKEGNSTLVIEEVTKQGPQQIAIKLSITEGATKRGRDYNYGNALQSRFTLYDAKGNKFMSYGGGWSNNNNSLQGTFHFGPPHNQAGVGEPAKLVFFEWSTVSHAVPFEFKDVPLP